MTIRSGRQVVLILLACLTMLLGVIAPGIAQANPNAQFVLVHNSGQPGMALNVKQNDPCPATQSGAGTTIVRASFTDASNNEVVPPALVAFADANGNWNVDPNTGGTVQISPYAVQGTGILKLWCDLNGTTTMEYATQPYSIAGVAASAELTKIVYAPGETVRVHSGTPCIYHVSNQGFTHNLQLLTGDWNDLANGMNFTWDADLGGTGVWEMKYPIPLLVNGPNGQQSPEGSYRFNASCWSEGRQMDFLPLEFSIRKLNYVAAGDSYSSGESIEPFEAGTASPGINTCHRSSKAYARLLEQRLEFNLGWKFAACSGAEAHHLTSTWNGNNLDEPAQWDYLGADTDLVTMTIGGNDMPFDEFAFACLAPVQSSCDGEARSEASAGIAHNVIPNVRNAMEALKTRRNSLGNNAAILVVGYPQLVDESWQGSCPLSTQEALAAREVITLLNTAIKNEVEAIGENFHFVSANESNSPFRGHELCRDDADPAPDFFYYDENPFTPPVYLLHPNEQGHAAYANLIQGWLGQNMHVLG